MNINPIKLYRYQKVYKTIKNSGLFDSKYYLFTYPDVRAQDIDPIKHYILYGVKERRNPSAHFDTKYYLTTYKDIEVNKINPLFHYIVFGWKENRNPSSSFDTKFYLDTYKDVKERGINPLLHFLKYGEKEARICMNCIITSDTLELLNSKANLVIIIPVFNAPNETKQCIDSVLKHTPKNVDILIINDCSTDEKVNYILSKYDNQNIQILHNEINLGYTKTINKGINYKLNSDIVLLNSDTIVGPNWISNLLVAAYTENNIGTVTPLSNNAGAFSAPNFNEYNEIGNLLSFDNLAIGISRNSLKLYPEVTTGSGFCMFIKRICINKVGLFDDVLFPKGYGEENDFCMRVKSAGFKNIVDDSTYIYHKRSASFGENKKELLEKSKKILNLKYPEYSDSVKKTFHSFSMNKVRENILKIMEKQSIYNKRGLYVISTLTGGTPQTNQDLMYYLNKNFKIETYVLVSNSQEIELKLYKDNVYYDVEKYILKSAIKPIPHTSKEYDDLIYSWIIKYRFDYVHIRHIAWHSLNLTKILAKLYIPTFFSFHDFYTICPSVKLLDNKMNFCNMECNKVEGDCPVELWDKNDLKELSTKNIIIWNNNMAKALDVVNYFVTTDYYAKDLLVKKYTFLKEKNFRIIPHGRDFTSFKTIDTLSSKKIRIVFPGNINEAKGSNEIIKLAKLMDKDNVEFHILGNISNSLKVGMEEVSNITYHGKYSRDSLPSIIEKIKPQLGGIFSIWPETYCHTLTELWACGLPVVAFDYGAVGSRIRQTGNGILVNKNDIGKIRNEILLLLTDKKKYNNILMKIKNWQHNAEKNESIAAMSKKYFEMYND